MGYINRDLNVFEAFLGKENPFKNPQQLKQKGFLMPVNPLVSIFLRVPKTDMLTFQPNKSLFNILPVVWLAHLFSSCLSIPIPTDVMEGSTPYLYPVSKKLLWVSISTNQPLYIKLLTNFNLYFK